MTEKEKAPPGYADEAFGIAVREPSKLVLAGFARGSLLHVRHRITSVVKGIEGMRPLPPSYAADAARKSPKAFDVR